MNMINGHQREAIPPWKRKRKEKRGCRADSVLEGWKGISMLEEKIVIAPFLQET